MLYALNPGHGCITGKLWAIRTHVSSSELMTELTSGSELRESILHETLLDEFNFKAANVST
jgi:hypothetical protein